MSSEPRQDPTEDDAHVPGEFPEEQQGQLSLVQAVYARRAEYTRPKRIKIKVGSWNVAAHKGAEKDIGGWLVGGKGVSAELSGMNCSQRDRHGEAGQTPGRPSAEVESVEEQEARRSKRESTIPKNDPGLVPGDDEIGIYAVGLQEVVDITSATEALRPYTDPATANKYKAALHEALPSGYELVADQQLIGLLILVFAAPGIASEISSVSSTSVGTGLMGYMGNKGAVTTRLVLGETTRIVFVNCHLAAGTDGASLDRRNWDAAQITSRTRFDPITDVAGIDAKSEGIGDEDFAFWFGDLNYRLQDMPGDDVRRLLMLHARNEYDLSQHRDKRIERDLSDSASWSESSSTVVSDQTSYTGTDDSTDATVDGDEEPLPTEVDPASLQATLSSLLPHDELLDQMSKRKAFHDGWREGQIRFMPTYKYNVGSVAIFDSSEKRRCPSWCDRILFRTRRDKLAYDEKISDETDVKKRDEEIRERGVDRASEDEEVLFDYNPDIDADEYDEFGDTGEPEEVPAEEGSEDPIQLEIYTSHQRVLSSDHKPLSAVFSFQYDAVLSDIKAKIHQEVARELDRVENEGRPAITLLVDRSRNSEGDDEGEKFEGVDFGAVRFGHSKRRTITIANTGQVAATVGFVDRPVDPGQLEGPLPVWLTAKFDREPDKESSTDQKHTAKLTNDSQGMRFTLEPGDASTATLSLKVDVMELVRDLNNCAAALEDILVLRVDNGRDHFLPIRAHWLQSALASSIDKLIRIPEGGIRRLQGQKPNSTTGHRTRANPPGPSPTSPGLTGAGETGVKKTTSTEQLAPAAKDHILPSRPKSTGNGEVGAALDTKTVKWSAPRELFRLTEAVESLAQRCVAEWDMSHNSPPALPPQPGTAPAPFSPPKVERSEEHEKPPWEIHSGWPFSEDSWSLWETDARKAATYAICEALDTDTSFNEAVDGATPVMARLEAMAGALVTFLSSLQDGVITEALWWQLEADIATRERDKTVNLSTEEEKSRVLDVMAEEPAHNISFVLVTSMLTRLIGELTTSDYSASVPSTPTFGHKREKSRESAHSAATTPMKGFNFMRRRTMGKVDDELGKVEKAEKAVESRRKLREKAYAVMFGDALVRLPDGEVMRDKEKKIREERRTALVGIFLKEEV